MPVYEYQCMVCNIEVEKIVRVDENINCPKCGREMGRKVSKCGFVLKGGGWADSGYNRKEGGK